MSNIVSRIAREWAQRAFGVRDVETPAIRALRMVEEAIELCQALDVPKDKVALTVETVYSRPVGQVEQEIGGVLLTMAVLTEVLGKNSDELLERELRRVLRKAPEHFARRKEEKIALGLDMPAGVTQGA